MLGFSCGMWDPWNCSAQDLFLSCGMQTRSCGVWNLFPGQGLNLGPLHWEHRVLVIGPPGKSQHTFTLILEILPERIGEREVILNEVDFMIPFTLTGEALIWESCLPVLGEETCTNKSFWRHFACYAVPNKYEQLLLLGVMLSKGKAFYPVCKGWQAFSWHRPSL